jgi:hypothetical protein
MPRILVTLMAVIGLLVMAGFYYHWDSDRNRGHTCGYYGEFNTVSNALAKMSGLTIVSSWHNADVTLEEFGFEVKTKEGRVLKLCFSEKSPLRQLAGDRLDHALAKEVRDVLAAQTNSPEPQP